MVDGCGTGGIGMKTKPLLSIEFSSLVRAQDDRFTQWSLFFYLICSLFKHNHTPSGKKTVTGVQVITASQAQSIRCRWQALFVLPITEAHTVPGW